MNTTTTTAYRAFIVRLPRQEGDLMGRYTASIYWRDEYGSHVTAHESGEMLGMGSVVEWLDGHDLAMTAETFEADGGLHVALTEPARYGLSAKGR